MSQIEAATYKSSACQGGLGNLSANNLSYTVTGNESNGDTVLLSKMNGTHTYTSVKLTCDTTRTGTVSLGYASRDAGEVDNATYFGGTKTLTNSAQEMIVAVKGPTFAHDIMMTFIDVGDIASGDIIQVNTLSVASAG